MTEPVTAYPVGMTYDFSDVADRYYESESSTRLFFRLFRLVAIPFVILAVVVATFLLASTFPSSPVRFLALGLVVLLAVVMLYGLVRDRAEKKRGLDRKLTSATFEQDEVIFSGPDRPDVRLDWKAPCVSVRIVDYRATQDHERFGAPCVVYPGGNVIATTGVVADALAQAAKSHQLSVKTTSEPAASTWGTPLGTTYVTDIRGR